RTGSDKRPAEDEGAVESATVEPRPLLDSYAPLEYGLSSFMIFIEDEGFHQRRKHILNEDEFFRLLEWLLLHPHAGQIIPHSGGLRKIRWAIQGRGKRGGARIIYFWWISDEKILLLDVYSKAAKENLTAGEIKKLKQKVIP